MSQNVVPNAPRVGVHCPLAVHSEKGVTSPTFSVLSTEVCGHVGTTTGCRCHRPGV